jgi:hypothetical protein
VGGVQRFCHAEEYGAMAEQIKQRPCPHCKVVGTLIQHGYLYGFDDSSPHRPLPRKTRRARRIFCSNRNLRPGCGRTFSIWFADKIRRLSLTAHLLWRFLQRAAAGSIAAAIRAINSHLSPRTWQRIWKRFDLGQSKIRTALHDYGSPPPDPPPRPAAQVLAHLQAAFPNADCPIAAFQHTLQTFFL